MLSRHELTLIEKKLGDCLMVIGPKRQRQSESQFTPSASLRDLHTVMENSSIDLKVSILQHCKKNKKSNLSLSIGSFIIIFPTLQQTKKSN